MFKYASFALLILFLFTQCGGDKKTVAPSIFDDAQTILLSDETTKVSIPSTFKQSTRFRLESDIPVFKKDRVRLRMMQNILANLEDNDTPVTIYVDTTTDYRLTMFNKIDRVTFDKTSGSILNQQVQAQFEGLEAQIPELNIEKIDSKIKGTDKLKMMKFKYKVTNKRSKKHFFASLYYLTTPLQTLVINEFSDIENDIEDYLWSTKDY